MSFKPVEICGPDAPAELLLSHEEETRFAHAEWSIRKTTLKAGRSQGVELIELFNGAQTLFILPTRGMGLWKVQSGDVRIGWDSPVTEPVHPAFVNIQDRNGLGWLEGFNELIVRCGLTSNGPPGSDDAAGAIEGDLTLHGRIANIPAHHVEFDIETSSGHPQLVVRGSVREAKLFGQNLELTVEYRTGLGERQFEVRDQVKNLASSPAELQLLYHINIGAPILQGGSRWEAPLQRVTAKNRHALDDMDKYSTYLPPTQGYAEQVYYCEPIADQDHRTLALLTNGDASQGISLGFSKSTLPCFSIWKNTQALADGYCTGLEPATNFPNFKAMEREQGRVVKLESGATWETSLTMTHLVTTQEVAGVQKRIAQLQGDTPPEIDRKLVPGISAEVE